VSGRLEGKAALVVGGGRGKVERSAHCLALAGRDVDVSHPGLSGGSGNGDVPSPPTSSQ
jgi:hypothetical protein